MSDQQQTTLCGDPDQDADTGIFFVGIFLPLRDRKIVRILPSAREVFDKFLRNFFDDGVG